MNFLFRAFLSVVERKGKSIILFFVITTICIFVLSGISIQSATEKSEILARQKLGATVTLSQNMQKQKEQMREQAGGPGGFKMERNPISLEDVEKVLTLSHITGYNVTSSTEGIADGFNPIKSSESVTDNTNNNNVDMRGPKEDGKRVMGDVSIEGVLSLEGVNEFANGEASLTSGEAITHNNKDEKVAVIEKTLAEENEIKVGDKIKVKSTVNTDSSVELKVIGIYETSSEIDEGAMRNEAMNPYNKIYTPYNVANTLKGSDYKDKVDSAVYYLDDPLNVDEFIEEGNKLDIDFDKYTLDANSREYEQMIKPIENVGSFAKTTVIIVGVCGALILCLIIMLSIKDRRNEIGILLSLGEKKFKIISQFAVEILLILSISLGVSLVAGNSISNVIADKLISKEVTAIEASSTNIYQSDMKMPGENGKGFSFRGPNNLNKENTEVIDELNVSVTGTDYLKMSGIAVLISILAVLLPAINVMKLQPKTILSKHD
ncbi:ABC transporter permease [Clostridium baratii]|uniref:FtsX-like permease family protein n=2 Tax=Clostridium baratii TaxID=1561 RepID=A0A0A7FT78_9CLOT|nr:FtsX-like permease family protein [Clostridium baratii]AIY82804.1 ftsX-like permease family protein [Clostridium baratii str. Sullivan]MDU4910153.1 FtsX-like permease family protein [Clostridium baratii]CUP29584.1 ABC transporter permease [Clostridium baratii]